MSAFDSLGLAMIPSAYKGEADVNNTGGYLGKVYSVLPEQTIGGDLITNGTFDSDTSWTKEVGWSINNGKATRSSDVITSASIISQNITPSSGKFLVKITVSDYSSGILRMSLNSTFSNMFAVISANGVYEFIATEPNANQINIQATGTSPSFSIDNVSVQLISDGDFDFSRGSDATRVNSQGYIESIQVLSDNLVTNGDFEQVGSELVANGDFESGDWPWQGLLIDQIEILDGKLNISKDSTFRVVYQAKTLPLNTIYECTVDVSNYVSGSFAISLAGSDLGSRSPIINSNGTFKYYIKRVTGGTNNVGFVFGGPAELTIDNFSIKQVNQGWTQNLVTSGSVNIAEVDGDKKLYFNAAAGANISNSLTFISGKKYRVQYTTSGYGGTGAVKISGGGSSLPFTGTSNTYTFEFLATSSNNLTLLTGGTPYTGYIDNISVIEITDDTDIPRIDYTNAACPSLLLEPTRMNLVLQSEYKSAGDFTNATFSYNSTISPRGVNDATKIIDDSTNGQHRVFIGSFPVTSGLDYTVSAFVKNNDVGFCYILLEGDFSQTRYYFNLSTGEAITSGLKVESFANGWYRIYVTQSAAATGTGTAYLNMAISGTSAIYSGTGQSLYFYGFQAELGSYPTSYIPTNGTTVTRLADVCHNAGDSTVFNDAEGVLYAEVKKIGNEGNYRAISLSDGTVNNVVRFYYSPIQDRINVEVKSNGAFSLNTFKDFPNKRDHIKLAIKYESGDLSFWVDGIKLSTSTSTAMPIGLRVIGFNDGSTSSTFQGDTRGLLYFNTALSDAELEALTSSDITRVLKNYTKRGTLLDATYESSYVQSRLNQLF